MSLRNNHKGWPERKEICCALLYMFSWVHWITARLPVSQLTVEDKWRYINEKLNDYFHTHTLSIYEYSTFTCTDCIRWPNNQVHAILYMYREKNKRNIFLGFWRICNEICVDTQQEKKKCNTNDLNKSTAIYHFEMATSVRCVDCHVLFWTNRQSQMDLCDVRSMVFDMVVAMKEIKLINAMESEYLMKSLGDRNGLTILYYTFVLV